MGQLTIGEHGDEHEALGRLQVDCVKISHALH
eukprot:CAMPEP_0181247888 /NCGR_PEP_ID=MMETSP1096-20121128/44865_1 /TAXON_ID=156174 ORGANISM="Chrysochromulina ericina, Strain CCMP281" /NCGR_SAMPLE_ID=MMETSP1096 /ASSEMBLY_ACC=CAM_ASM_000453 /LENGTH=31 /DNA_ID= /DNA_START= /DNA_END= /DNA_ORIENTATION=